jgi:hypothetical protein
VSWLVGARDAEYADAFMSDVSERVSTRIQLTSDGHRPYLEAVEGAFGIDIDYAVLQKLYGQEENPEKRYSPAVCIGAKQEIITGNPNPRHISTSYVKRLERLVWDAIYALQKAGNDRKAVRLRRAIERG